jgi:uncharacterized tellurite resistance protein B-like protein
LRPGDGQRCTDLVRYPLSDELLQTNPMPQQGPFQTAETKSASEAFQQKLSDGLMGLFELVISNRRGYYVQHPENIPTIESIGSIVDSYSTKNAVISGGFNLVPGPWGLVGIVPELTIIFRNQLMLIYDIGVAHGKQRVLTKELLAGVLLDAFGIGAGSLFVMQGSKLIVKRVSLRVFQRIVALLAGRVTQQALKSALSKWVPVLGAAAMAAWVHYMTKKIGQKATQIPSQEISLDNEETDIGESLQMPEASLEMVASNEVAAVIQRLRILVCLAAIDGSAHDQEAGFIKEIMSNYEIPAVETDHILDALRNSQLMNIDYSILAANPSDSVGVLLDMVALSKRDGSDHPAERIYIRKVGQILGVSDADIDDLIRSA